MNLTLLFLLVFFIISSFLNDHAKTSWEWTKPINWRGIRGRSSSARKANNLRNPIQEHWQRLLLVDQTCKMAEHDLTSKLGNYLDRHLVFPLFEFLAVQGVSKLLFEINLYPLCSYICLGDKITVSIGLHYRVHVTCHLIAFEPKSKIFLF